MGYPTKKVLRGLVPRALAASRPAYSAGSLSAEIFREPEAAALEDYRAHERCTSVTMRALDYHGRDTHYMGLLGPFRRREDQWLVDPGTLAVQWRSDKRGHRTLPWRLKRSAAHRLGVAIHGQSLRAIAYGPGLPAHIMIAKFVDHGGHFCLGTRGLDHLQQQLELIVFFFQFYRSDLNACKIVRPHFGLLHSLHRQYLKTIGP